MKAVLVAATLAVALALTAAVTCTLTPRMVGAVQSGQTGAWLIALWASNWLVRLLPLLSVGPALVAVIGAARVNSTPTAARPILLVLSALTLLVATPWLAWGGTCSFMALTAALPLGFGACYATAILTTRIHAKAFRDGLSRVPTWVIGLAAGIGALFGPAVVLPALWVWRSAGGRERAIARA
jgi:hypothetical protein